MIIILFEFIQISEESKFELDYDFFINTLRKFENINHYQLHIKEISKEKQIFNIILENEDEIEFISILLKEFKILILNIEIFEKERKILLDFLNRIFEKEKIKFNLFIPKRSNFWNLLKSAKNIIELKLFTENGLEDYNDYIKRVDPKFSLTYYPIYSSLVTFELENKVVSTYIYGNKINIPTHIFNRIIELTDKLSPLFLEA